MKTTHSLPTMKLLLQRMGETLKTPCDRWESLSHLVLEKNSIFHSIFPRAANLTKRVTPMAAHCFGILSITDTLSEHLEVEDEVRLYGTCSSIYEGNKAHRDILKELRDYYYAYHVPPTLQRFVLYPSLGSNEEQEAAQRAPPLYRVWLEFRLEDLYDRRPETMPIADDPCWDAD